MVQLALQNVCWASDGPGSTSTVFLLISSVDIWIDGDGGLRSKGMTMEKAPKGLQDLKEWNFDGSSTNQAPGDNADVMLVSPHNLQILHVPLPADHLDAQRPVAIFRDPFRGGANIMVMCECYNNDGTPNHSNYRAHCKKVMEQTRADEPWFGLEQEYTLFDADGQVYGWPKMGFPGPQGPYYCGVGTGKVFARDFIEAHYVNIFKIQVAR